METITKAWCYKHSSKPRQRTVQEMKDHRKQTGASGNCFDLALWLKEELQRAGIEAYYVGENFGTTEAHVGVIAVDSEGNRYLCDLGDLWIQPLNIEKNAHEVPGFFAGALISTVQKNRFLEVSYLRTNGKVSHQSYDLSPVNDQDFLEAANVSQANLSEPLIEMRIYEPYEVIHWEYETGHSFLSTMSGLKEEAPETDLAAWSRRIEKRTQMKASYVLECLEFLGNRQSK